MLSYYLFSQNEAVTSMLVNQGVTILKLPNDDPS